MAIIRVNAVLKHHGGLARDNVVNSFHFEGNPVGMDWGAFLLAVRGFYYVVDPTAISNVAHYLSHTVDTIDMHAYIVPGTIDPATGRETTSGPPVGSLLGGANDLANSPKGSAADLPAECAIAISYQGTPGPGLVQRRRRGRVFIGPLNNFCVDTNTLGARPTARVRQDLAAAFNRMLVNTDGLAEHVIYSRPFAGRVGAVKDNGEPKPDLPPRAGVTVGTDQIWVDDEFDTIRKRGLLRTGRTLITAAG